MKRKLSAVLITLGLLMLISACSAKKEETTAAPETTAAVTQAETTAAETEAESETPQMVGMPNPWIDCASMEEAEKIAGFEMSCPTFDDLPVKEYQAMENSTIQVFNRGEGESDICILVRKAIKEDSDDISGDYGKYAKEDKLDIGGLTVTAKGDDGYSVAIWTDGDYAYSITVDGAELSENHLKEYIPHIK